MPIAIPRSAPSHEPTHAERPRPAVEPSTQLATPSAEPAPSETVAVAPPPSTEPPPPPCTTDADCAWDDPKTRGACVLSLGGKHAAASTRGHACRCAEGACVLVRSEAERRLTRVTCQDDSQCGFDAAHGVCTPGPVSTRPAGVGCACDTQSHECVELWTGSVPCRTTADCGQMFFDGRGRFPVPAWLSPRSRPGPIDPCHDAESDSLCNGSQCAIVAWRC